MLCDDLVSLDNIRVLQEDLLRASFCERKDSTFVNCMYSSINEYVKLDEAGIGIAVVSNNLKMDISKSKHFIYKVPDDSYIKYCNWSTIDPYFMRLINEPGKTLVHRDSYNSYDEFLNSQIFNRHYKVFELYHSLAVVLRIPNTNYLMFLSVHRSELKDPFNVYDVHFIDAIFPHLFSIWAGRLGLYNFIALGQKTSPSLTPSELKIVQLLAEEEAMFSAKELARKLNKSHRVVENQLGVIYRKLNINGVDKKIQLIKMSQSLL